MNNDLIVDTCKYTLYRAVVFNVRATLIILDNCMFFFLIDLDKTKYILY